MAIHTCQSAEVAPKAPDLGGSPDGSTDGSQPSVTVPLTPEIYEDQSFQLFVPVRYGGVEAFLMLDTGSALSFLFMGKNAAPFTPNAATLELGGKSLTVAGRNLETLFPNKIQGKAVIGLLGADYLLQGVVELDLRCYALRVWEKGDRFATWDAAPFDDVQGHIIVPLGLDKKRVRLMLDTGAPHLVHLGAQPTEGEQPVLVQDADGQTLTFYVSTAELEIAAEHYDVTIERAASWPYFQQTVEILGGNIHGLLGLSALQNRSVVFQKNDLHFESTNSPRTCAQGSRSSSR